MQGRTGKKGNATAVRHQCMIDRDQGDQQKKEPLDQLPDPDAVRSKQASTLAKKINYHKGPP
jgi:hypothetical protein